MNDMKLLKLNWFISEHYNPVDFITNIKVLSALKTIIIIIYINITNIKWMG